VHICPAARHSEEEEEEEEEEEDWSKLEGKERTNYTMISGPL
jgi:hypothetical protein